MNDIQGYRAKKIEEQRNARRSLLPTQLTTIPAGVVGTPGQASMALAIPSDCDFMIQGISGKFTVPAGETPNAAVQMTDTSNGLTIIDGYADLDTFLSPGPAGNGLQIIYPFEYFIGRNKAIRFDFINRSTTDVVVVAMTFHGRKLS